MKSFYVTCLLAALPLLLGPLQRPLDEVLLFACMPLLAVTGFFFQTLPSLGQLFKALALALLLAPLVLGLRCLWCGGALPFCACWAVLAGLEALQKRLHPLGSVQEEVGLEQDRKDPSLQANHS